MNRQQTMDLLKGLTMAGGPLAFVIAAFFPNVDVERVLQGVGGLVSIAGVVWTIYDARRASTITKAASIEGVQVHVNTATAPADVTAVALKQATSNADPVSDVVPMIGGARTDGKVNPEIKTGH